MRSAIAVAVIAVVLAILRPWTVVPIDTKTPGVLDPASYVASMWEARVVPAAERSAIDLQAFMQGAADAGPARAVFVKGTARIADIDRTSRVGLARLSLPWAKDGAGAAVQIGPVIRGTAVRDALDFIRFTDFVNQLEFASVASALNDRVLSTVLEPATGVVTGAEITFIGATPTSRSAPTVEIVPVTLAVVPGTAGSQP